MVKFQVQVMLNTDLGINKEVFNIKSENPNRAAKTIIEKNTLQTREIEVGDAVLVHNMGSHLRNYFLIDNNYRIKEVSKSEFDFWQNVVSKLAIRTAGVDVVMKTALQQQS